MIKVYTTVVYFSLICYLRLTAYLGLTFFKRSLCPLKPPLLAYANAQENFLNKSRCLAATVTLQSRKQQPDQYSHTKKK